MDQLGWWLQKNLAERIPAASASRVVLTKLGGISPELW